MSWPPGSARSPEREEPDEEHSSGKVAGVFSLDTQSLPLRTEKVVSSAIYFMVILQKHQRIMRFSEWSAFQCMLIDKKGEGALTYRRKRLEDR
jgi:hypothetical protein